jgi:hypothetical protein
VCLKNFGENFFFLKKVTKLPDLTVHVLLLFRITELKSGMADLEARVWRIFKMRTAELGRSCIADLGKSRSASFLIRIAGFGNGHMVGLKQQYLTISQFLN